MKGYNLWGWSADPSAMLFGHVKDGFCSFKSIIFYAVWNWSILFLRFPLPWSKSRNLVELYKFWHKLFKWICFIGKVHEGGGKHSNFTHTHTQGEKKKTVFTYSREFPIWHQGIIQVSVGSLEIILWSPRSACQLLPYVNVVFAIWTLIP